RDTGLGGMSALGQKWTSCIAWPMSALPPKVSGDWLLRNPIIGILGCWARAASGQARTEPVTALMKSRRRIALPTAYDHANSAADYSRDLRSAKWGSGVSLRSSNPKPLMSALGQKQTLKRLHPMSASPPNADIGCVPQRARRDAARESRGAHRSCPPHKKLSSAHIRFDRHRHLHCFPLPWSVEEHETSS